MKEQNGSPIRFILLLLFFLSVGWVTKSFLADKKSNHSSLEEFEEDDSPKKKIKRSIASQKNIVKTPTPRPTNYQPKLTNNHTVRKNEAADPVEAHDNSGEQTDSGNNEQTTSVSVPSGSRSYSSPSSSASSQASSSSKGGKNLVQTTLAQGNPVTFENIATTNSQTTTTPTGSSSSGNSSSNSNNHGNTLSCSASVPNGSYSYALSVTLSCSTSATIKYCLSEGTCCDPETMGVTYSNSAPIIIGENNAQYCLSYYAVSTTNSHTSASQRVYNISKQLPDLYTETPIQWMQTTEAPIYISASSNNFGNNSFSLAQISYLGHDIGPTGDNLNCKEVATEMGSYNSPSPLYSLSPFDVSGITPSQQVEIPLSPANLDYGVNYVATYMMNSTGAVPSYACSISEITLMDFPLFGASAISQSGELVGGFSPYGFYEVDLNLPRSPAGESSFSNSTQKIETAFLSIIY